jgi:LmbE family N-acetylglucosaminyl deacetylase
MIPFLSHPARVRSNRPRRVGFLCAMACFGLWSAAMAETLSPSAILQELRAFRETGSVLYVAAHPDDENTQLIAYLSRGRNYRTAYLSLTRGDGGQNVLGPEFGEQLGVIRTQELLAARRIDGGRQFFTRAIDFGFSKDYQETLTIWNKKEVLSDIVRVIRTFHPDVIITRFSPQPGGTHGHHTASAVLAIEAFKLAGDTNAFPEQLKTLQPWQPKRILMNGRGNEDLKLDISGNDSVSGLSFNELAARSRAMHKTQGFDNFRGFGGAPRPESFQLLAGEPAEKDILEGVDTSWKRFSGGEQIEKIADEIISRFNSQNPAASVPDLLKLRSALVSVASDPVVNEKRQQLDRILQACLGLETSTSIAQAEVVPGEPLKLQHTITLRSDVPARWIGTRHPSVKEEFSSTAATNLLPNAPLVRTETVTLPPATSLTQPYWLREERGIGLFRVANAALIGTPENAPAFPIEQVFEISGQTLVVPDEPMQTDPHRRLNVIPPVALHFVSDVELFSRGTARTVEVELTAFRDNQSGALRLNAPADWKIKPLTQPFKVGTAGEKKRFTFEVTAPATSATARIDASAEIGNATYRTDRIAIDYKHVPPQLLQPIAQAKVVSVDLATRGKRIGYVPGAGDSVAESLKEMGYQVTTLTGPDLTTNTLKGLDAVVIGIRAFNVRSDLADRMPALFDFVQNGGNVIVQYNRPGNDLKTDQLAPYTLKISQERVTDENAPVTFLATNHPALNVPNRITSADFEGWVQERGVYFPNQWDEHFTPILACNDPGETPKSGALLIAQHGKGYFVYTGLAFFRQLPAGVPGAYRLFANLVSLGK